MKRIYDNYDRFDLTEGMRNKECPNGPNKNGWGAGQQLEALDFYRPAKFEVLFSIEEEGYSGEIYGVAVWDLGGENQRYVLWTDSFGSCYYCDALEDSNGYEYIHDVLMSNAWQFLTLEDLREYLNEKHERFYSKECIGAVKRWLDGVIASGVPTTELRDDWRKRDDC